MSFPGRFYTVLESGEVVGAFQPVPLNLIAKRAISYYIRKHKISTDYAVGDTWPIVQYKLSVLKENISSLPLPSSVRIDLQNWVACDIHCVASLDDTYFYSYLCYFIK